MIRVATDVGGTFTDLAAYDSSANEIIVAKASTTTDISTGVADAVTKAGIAVRGTDQFIHGSTIAINTVIEKKGSKTGLLTTKGFRDTLEIARGNIINSFDLMFTTPEPLVPRRHRLELIERIYADGSITTPIDEEQTLAALRQLTDAGVEAVAVCLLHAYANPVHEQKVHELIKRQCGNSVFASISSDLLREYREFERTSTAVLNAYVGPRVSAYIDRMHRYLADGGFSGNAMIMQSNGGTMTFDLAKSQPVRTMESGPVGGTVAAAHIAAKSGFKNVVAFDMGGTTAKISIVRDGRMEIADGYWIGGEELGYPLQLPVVDVVEIGAGGGSIARIDEMGGLKVGPTSANAVPGPACYRRGGTLPTVTDANLVLGRLNPDFFLGGELKLSAELAETAIREHVAAPLHLETARAAFGIVKIADTHMAHAARLMTVQKGHDPRDFVMVAYGGAGPAHAAAVARALGIKTLVIPCHPGILSAVGMLLTNAKEEFILSHPARLEDMSLPKLEELFAEMEAKGAERMRAAGFQPARISTWRAVEMRYSGQEFTLRLPLTEPTNSKSFKATLARQFTEMHELRYGHAFAKATPEIVSLRVEVSGNLDKPALTFQHPPATRAKKSGKRRVYFEYEGFVDCTVLHRTELRAGDEIPGPVLIEEMASTTLVHPGDVLRIDNDGNLVITLAAAREHAREQKYGVAEPA
ncbi:MAG TPA: hydantoinase/oxoprolinase family protein [Alphaproteobacteria bacterium]|jgi:N-methylhydantoinase A